MGFRTGSFATIWSVEPVSDTLTKARISISRKDTGTNEYMTDFSGFVSFIGTAAAKKGACLKEKDRIRLKDVDVSTKYVPDKNATYTNFKVYSFETQEEVNNSSGVRNDFTGDPEPRVSVDSGEVDDSRLPF